MAKAADFRIIFKSELIVNSPMAYLTDLPADLKAAIKKPCSRSHSKDKAAFDKIYEGKQLPFVRGRPQGLRAHRRHDQVRRRAAQEEASVLSRHGAAAGFDPPPRRCQTLNPPPMPASDPSPPAGAA